MSLVQWRMNISKQRRPFFSQPHKVASWFCYITYWTFLLPIRRTKLAIEIDALSKNQMHCQMSQFMAHYSWCPAYHFIHWNARHWVLNIFKNIIHNQILVLIHGDNVSTLFAHFIQSICILKALFKFLTVEKSEETWPLRSRYPQGSTSVSIFWYQKPTPPTYQAYEQPKRYGGKKDWAASPIWSLTSWFSFRDSSTSIFSAVRRDFSSTNYQTQPELVPRWLVRPSLNWITDYNPLLKQILQVNLIDQLFSLMHPLASSCSSSQIHCIDFLTKIDFLSLQWNHDEATHKKARVPDQQHQLPQCLRHNRSVQETNCFYKEKNN